MAVTKATWTQKSTGNTIHPETEVDQLKASGTTALASIISTLLKATTTANARSAISAAAASHQHSTGDITQFASKVVEAIGSETLAALGVSYSITTNGYICFGDLFGGLILQWTNLESGVIEISGGSKLELDNNPLPIAFPHSVLADTAITRGYGYGQWVIYYAQCLVVADPNNGFPYTGNSKTHYSVRLKNIAKESDPASKGVSIYFISLGY